MFTKTLIASALASLVAAQSTVLTFTHVPNPITDGQAQAITYSTNDTTTPVTIILRKGVQTDLQTISTLTTTATSGQYIWTPSTSLANGVDYALQIVQGSQFNYFGPFTIQGASASAVSSASVSSTASSSAFASSTISANGTASTTIPVGTIGSGMATGTSMPRNTTMSIASLTSTGSATSMTGSASTHASGTTTGAAAGSASASAKPSSASSGASAIQMGSVFPLFIGAAAAVFYL
ncbi:hypothetical protein LTR86_005424 [Recurvomyces mirabilis]|nr:hypothetical protein LTR86_005424 [Recurvomyces mirabilis]